MPIDSGSWNNKKLQFNKFKSEELESHISAVYDTQIQSELNEKELSIIVSDSSTVETKHEN
jgi:methionine salvage enolase-phosphatase E1